jgi:catechol 2,3-dioxygenase-like lactoylglutathione lyase family enzyme
MSVLGLDHVSVSCADLERSLAYARPAGAPLAPAVHRPGAGHLSLRVDDVDALSAAVRAAGFRTLSPEPVTLGNPGFWRGARLVYAIDPDGVAVELIHWPGPAPRP